MVTEMLGHGGWMQNKDCAGRVAMREGGGERYTLWAENNDANWQGGDSIKWHVLCAQCNDVD